MSALDETRLARRREQEAARRDAEDLDRLLYAEYWREEHFERGAGRRRSAQRRRGKRLRPMIPYVVTVCGTLICVLTGYWLGRMRH